MRNVISLFILSCTAFCAFSQNTDADSIHEKDTLAISPDNPAIAAIDMALNMPYLEFNKVVCDSNIIAELGYSPDTVPVVPDSILKTRLATLNATSPFHFIYNDAVKKWIDLYVIKKRKFSSKLVGLSYSYYPLIEQSLDKYDLPYELKHLAIVESALNPMARSRSGAVGLWQFIYKTGLLMGLEINSYVDERRDIYKSTLAACEYFSYLFNIYNNWELVLAAYNCGPGNVNRALRKAEGKTDYWEIWPYLPRETRGYVPAFYAANYLMNYYTLHNICPATPKMNYFDYDTVYIHKSVTLTKLSAILDVPHELLTYLNPAYKRDLIPVTDEPRVLNLPLDKKGIFITNEQCIYQIEKDTSFNAYLPDLIQKTHIVRSGQYLGYIAKKYKCTISDIKDWNGLRSTRIYPGQRLIVYIPEKKPKQEKKSKKHEKPTNYSIVPNSSYKYYTIQKGDTLWDIAKQYGITVENILQLNKGINERNLKPGTKIKITSKG